MYRKRSVDRGSWSRMAGVALVGALLLTACGDGSGTNGEDPAADDAESEPDATGDESAGDGDDEDTVVIGVAMKTQLQPRWEFDVQAMEQRAAEVNAELIVQWANDDADLQAGQVENLLSQGIDALIIAPVDGVAAGASASAAKAEGVPVISYDIGIEETEDVDYFVVRDSHEVGVLQAEAALEFAPEGKYVLIEGDAANDVAQAISAGHHETLDGTDVEIVFDDWMNWDPQAALETAENQLSVHGDDIRALLTANDGMAGGAIQALEARNMVGEVFVSGLDADVANLGFILEGAQTMSVWTKIDEQGVLAVDAAVGIVRGNPPAADMTINNGATDVPALLAPVFPVNADNLCEFITTIAPEGWVTVEDVFDDPSDCA